MTAAAFIPIFIPWIFPWVSCLVTVRKIFSVSRIVPAFYFLLLLRNLCFLLILRLKSSWPLSKRHFLLWFSFPRLYIDWGRFLWRNASSRLCPYICIPLGMRLNFQTCSKLNWCFLVIESENNVLIKLSGFVGKKKVLNSKYHVALWILFSLSSAGFPSISLSISADITTTCSEKLMTAGNPVVLVMDGTARVNVMFWWCLVQFGKINIIFLLVSHVSASTYFAARASLYLHITFFKYYSSFLTFLAKLRCLLVCLHICLHCCYC